MANQRVPAVATIVGLPDFIRAVIRAWSTVSDQPCTREAIAVLWAQNQIETGGKHCYGWNLGNLKWSDGHDYHCLSGVWEGVTPSVARRLIASGDAIPDPSASHAKQVGPNKVSVLFQNGHPASRFRTFANLDDAMVEHLKLLATSRYKTAWPAVLAGDYVAFAKALHARGYFTASPTAYANGMRRFYEDACTSTVFDKTMQDFIPDQEVIPPLPEGTPIIHPFPYADPPEDDDEPA